MSVLPVARRLIRADPFRPRTIPCFALRVLSCISYFTLPKSESQNPQFPNPRHPPEEGIMSPKIVFRDISRATEVERQNACDRILRPIAAAQTLTYQDDAAASHGATQPAGNLCRQKRDFATKLTRP
jgi:hypothetical protein